MIISKKYANQLIAAGEAAINTNPDHPNDLGNRFVAVTRYDIPRTDHYEK